MKKALLMLSLYIPTGIALGAAPEFKSGPFIELRNLTGAMIVAVNGKPTPNFVPGTTEGVFSSGMWPIKIQFDAKSKNPILRGKEIAIDPEDITWQDLKRESFRGAMAQIFELDGKVKVLWGFFLRAKEE